MTAKPSPELLEMARKFTKNKGVSTTWEDGRVAMAEFGELVARTCAKMVDEMTGEEFHADKYNTLGKAILRRFNLKEGE